MKFRLKPLVSLMTVLPVMFLPTSTALFASDLSIYAGNSVGKTSILLMLDTSGSMGISSLVLPKSNIYGSPGDVVTSSLCARTAVSEYTSTRANKDKQNILEWSYNLKDPISKKTAILKTVTIGGTTIPYYVRGCTDGTITQYDRLSRLKDAILPLLAGTDLKNEVIMGLGQFSSKTNLTIGTATNTLTDGHSGRILVPNAPLNNNQRIKIAQQIAAIKSLDTVTDEDGTSNNNLNLSSSSYPDVTKASSGTPTAHAYAEAGAYMLGTGTGGGGVNSGKVSTIYDGYMVMQNGTQQVYFVCVGLGPSNSSALGATVRQCDNNWPSYDSKLKTVGVNTVSGVRSSGQVSGTVYKPDGSGGWTPIIGQTNFQKEVPAMNNGWETFTQLPVGWRYGGWMRVSDEPMDIEPIVGTVWTGYAGGTIGIVSYRSNPFSLDGVNDSLVGGFAYSDSTTKNGSVYAKGGSVSSCDGNGIYFLTDGAPNSTKDSMAQTILNTTLQTSKYQFITKPVGTGVLVSPVMQSGLFPGETGGWEYIGEYSKKLLDPAQNPSNMSIKTAVVGFGSSFEGLTKNADGTYNCASTSNLDIQNACKWGSKGAGYGEGGFYQATNSDDIANSILQFIKDVPPKFSPSSLGSISVPRDPLDQTQLMNTGFFPMVQPIQDSTARSWAGNLKKYKILSGTLKDDSGNNLYVSDGVNQTINPSAKDSWALASAIDNSLVNNGGAWNKIPVPSGLNITGEPSSATSSRNVFVVDGTDLKQVTKSSLATDYTGTTPSALSSTNINLNQRFALLNYLGYQATFPPTATATLTTTDLTNYATPTSPYRYMGGVVHSTPLVVTKTATLQASTNNVGSRSEYVVYGSMDGGLHIVDSATGEEKSVFVPKEILNNQYDTLASANAKAAGSLTGLAYGVDAPWTADNQFKVQTTTTGGSATTKYTATSINIYGGLRMGGQAIYGLDILDPTTPKMKFYISPSTTGFGRLGQIWSKPTLAEMRVKGVRTKVLIFGGGYDASVYEKPSSTFTEPTTATQGNALYIVDANTGALIWMTSSDTTGVTAATKKITNSNILYSVVGQPVVRDYDADGLADMIYFADLGGQIFRVDLNNANQASTTVDNNIAVRVQRIANLRQGSGATLFVPRFYDRLTTAVFDNGSDRLVLVTGGSGNRSYPLEATVVQNKIYGILDYDAATNGIEKAAYDTTKFLAEASSTNLASRGTLGGASTAISFGASGTTSDDKFATAMSKTGTLRGWMFNLKSTSDATSQYYSKSFEEPQLISKDLYVNVYDPKSTLSGTTNGCGGGIQGVSTTHRICAPFGDCAAYVNQGYQGIIGPAMGPNTDARILGLIGPIAATKESCVGKCSPDNTVLTDHNLYSYGQARKIKPTRWFEW